MNWQHHQTLAAGYRDQGLADYLAARVVQQVAPSIDLRPGLATSLAHVVVVKCQQASEKLIKSYRLWHDASFKPTAGHDPVADLLAQVGQIGGQLAAVTELVAALNRAEPRLVGELRWLGRLAPRTPDVPPALVGTLLPLDLLVENTEYPYWLAADNRLVTPAAQFTHAVDGVRAVRATTALCRVLARSDPRALTDAVRGCLASHPPSEPIPLPSDAPGQAI